MTKPKKIVVSCEEKQAMDAILRRMLSTPPQPSVTPVKASRSAKKAVNTSKKR